MSIENKTRSITLYALFVALVILGAFLKIPLPLVPVTLQLFFVLLSGMLLGPRGGFTVVGIYLLMGLLGLPVFTQGGGPGYFFKPTFGYLLGFFVAAGLTGWLSQKRKGRLALFLAALLGLAAVYALGLFHLYWVTRWYGGKALSLSKLFYSGMVIFLPGDILSCTVASLVAERLRKLPGSPFFLPSANIK